MQAGVYQNGYIEQAVTIESVMECTLSFKQKAFSTNYAFF